MALKFLGSPSHHNQLPLFVYFPGMDGTGQLFGQQTRHLSHRFDVRCLAMPCNDLSSWDKLVAATLDLIQLEMSDASRQIYLCGESFGACWAMLVAAKIPQVHQLTLINPASSFARFPWLTMGSLFADALPDPLYQASAQVVANLLIEKERVSLVNQQNLILAMRSIAARTAAWRLGLLRQFQVHTVVPKLLDIPTLLIVGERDRLLPSSLEVKILQRELLHAQTIFLPHSGHACLLETETNLAQLLSS